MGVDHHEPYVQQGGGVVARGAESRWRLGREPGLLRQSGHARRRARARLRRRRGRALGCMAAGDTRSNCVDRGICFLLRTQRKDGSWWEKTYTGTGFPKVFYLKYHMYAEYFPLLALATYSQVMKSLQRADKSE